MTDMEWKQTIADSIQKHTRYHKNFNEIDIQNKYRWWNINNHLGINKIIQGEDYQIILKGTNANKIRGGTHMRQQWVRCNLIPFCAARVWYLACSPIGV